MASRGSLSSAPRELAGPFRPGPRDALARGAVMGVVMGAMFAVALAPRAAAQEGDATYRRLAEDAARAVSERRLPEALALFREMHAMAPSARTLWSLGRVHYEQTQYVVALEYLEQALGDPRRPLEGAQREEAVSLRDRALALVGEYAISVTPPDATVLLDDVVARGATVRLDPGDHVLRFERAGHQPTVRRLVVRGGERERVDVTLEPSGGGALAADVMIGGLIGTEIARDVRVEVRSAEPGLSLHLQPYSLSGTPGPMGPMAPVCAAPCTQTVRSGLYVGGLSRDGEDPVSATGTLMLEGDYLLDVVYHDETATRIVGVTLLIALGGYGIAGTTVGALMLDQAYGFYDSGGGVAMLTTGVVSLTLGLCSLLFPFIPDWAEIRAAPAM